MFYILLAVLYAATRSIVVSTTECEPSKYLCSGVCPQLPEGLQLKSETICLRDTESDACVCWLHNPARQLHSLFRCEAKINGSVSQVMCNPPSDCFSPDPKRPVCMIILQCHCLPLETRFPHDVFDHWRRVKAVIHTKEKPNGQDYEGHSVEKIPGEIREFRLKHLLFLLGFVIAPLLCWCLLNFFHEGKCRKKASEPPEAQPMPTSRCSTIDNMNNDDTCGERVCDDIVVVTLSPTHHSSSVRSQSVPIVLPSAPEECLENTAAPQQTLPKCESPPPYCESMERNFHTDFGPPPTYEDAVRGTDVNIQQLWQTVFILQPGAVESS